MILNIIGFNITWLGLVFWGNSFIPIALLLLLIHIVFISKVTNETLLIASITFIGVITDSLLQIFQVFIFENDNHLPFWLMILWGCFAATICHSLALLSVSKFYQMVVGGFFAPLSYLAGYRLNVIDFSQSVIVTYGILSVVWAGLFTLFFYLKSTLTQTGERHA